jgi:homoserine dehydrogenase
VGYAKVDDVKVATIALLGFGTIGSSVYAVIQREHDAILDATGVDLRVAYIVEKDFRRAGIDAPADLFTRDFQRVLDDPSVSIVVELIGGTEWAFTFVEGALRSGRDVVTANKQLLANRGAALFDLADQLGRQIRFEASVGGAIPIIKVMRESMIAADLHTVYGIVNGTTNYILTAMYRGEGDYADTLKKAQDLGYAEADPTADVGGADAAAKMAILASLAYRSRVTMGDVTYEGIEKVSIEDVDYAKQFGFVVKLIGAARLIDGRVNVRVHPALVPESHPLASINGSYNAVYLKGHTIDEIMLTGPGAGGPPTATAVVSDIVNIAGTDSVGFLQNCTCYKALDPCPDGEMHSAFFIRFKVEDRSGVLAQIASIFGEHDVSIESMIQKGQGDEAELMLITHPTMERGFFAAIEQVAGLSCAKSRPMTIRVL